MAVRDGKVTFGLEDGRVLDMNTSDPQLSRTGTSTVHAFQGRTVDTVVATLAATNRTLSCPVEFAPATEKRLAMAHGKCGSTCSCLNECLL